MRRLASAIVSVLLATALAGCRRRAPEIQLPEWQSEIARPADQWLRDPAIRLLRDYVRIPTIDPPGNERPGAEFLKSYLACEGIPSELICPEKDRCNLYARIKGHDPNRAILLLNHIDVVPVNTSAWKHPPFGGEIFQSFLYGRGVYDMKSIGIAELLAFVDLADSGISPARDVVFLAECGEEMGWKDGVAWLFEHRPDALAGVDCVLNEGGYMEMVTGTPRYWGIETGAAGMAYAVLSSDDKEALTLPARFRSLGMFVPPEPTVARFLREIAEFRPPFYANAFLHPELLRRPEVQKFIPYASLGLVTGGVLTSPPYLAKDLPGIASPHRWDMSIVVSTPVGIDPRPSFEATLAAILRPGVDVMIQECEPPSRPSPFPTQDTEGISRVLQASAPGVPAIPVINSFGDSTSSIFRRRGIPAYGFTPYLMDPIDAARRHGNDERLFLPFFTRGIPVMREVLYELATTNVQK